MIDLIKSIIWMAILIFAGYYLMGYFGYEINPEFFSYSKKQCQEKISECTSSVVQKGLGSAEECQFDCVDPELIIKKKQ